MTKAEKAADKKYPKRKDGRTRYCNCTDDDIRRVYAQGYRKAEKDLELTWEYTGYGYQEPNIQNGYLYIDDYRILLAKLEKSITKTPN